MMLAGYWLLLAPVAPLLVAFTLMVWPAMRRSVLPFAPWAAVPALLLTLLPWNVTAFQLPSLLLGSQIGLDSTGQSFLLLSALVWWTGGLHIVRSKAHPQSPRFMIFFLLAMAGNLGAIIAHDILSFYCCFALMSFAAYGLVIHKRSPQALRAARIYIMFVLLGEVLLLSALMLAALGVHSYDFASIRVAVAASEQRELILLLIITGLGIKTGLLGVHFTLPLIYRAAPLAAAAVLAGAMINAGLLGWLRLLPLGHVTLLEWGTALIALGLMAAFYGVLVGLTQRHSQTLLAYSSISQMGILTSAVGIGLTAPQAWPPLLAVITLYAVHHGLAKAALFLGLGVVQHSPDSRRWRWLLGAGLLLPALALAGAPLTSGMLVKVLLNAEIVQAPALWAKLLGWLLPLSALTTTLLMARFIYLSWPRATDAIKTETHPANLWSWGLLITASLSLVWILPHPAEVALASLLVWWSSLWPVITGMVIAAIFIRYGCHHKISIPEIPAGDLLVYIEFIAQRLLKVLTWLTVEKLPRGQKQLFAFTENLIPRTDWNKCFTSLEVALTRWSVAVTLLVLLILAIALLPLFATTVA